METTSPATQRVPLDVTRPLWDQVFTIAPIVIIGSREPDGRYNLAVKHMVTPASWENYFAFVCTVQHATYHNIVREKAFTVSYPLPSQIVTTSMTASPRCDDHSKPLIDLLPTFPAEKVDGRLLEDAYLHFECELDRMVDDLGPNSMIIGRIVAALALAGAQRSFEVDDHELIGQMPLLAYLAPGRYAKIAQSYAFPFPQGIRY